MNQPLIENNNTQNISLINQLPKDQEKSSISQQKTNHSKISLLFQVPDSSQVEKNIICKLLAASLVCFILMCAEAVGGYIAGSLAILTDAAHMLSDLLSFFISVISLWLAKKQSTQRLSYGYHRAEVIGALASILLIWGLTIGLIVEAVQRVINIDSIDIDSSFMLYTSIFGLICNLIMGKILHSSPGGHHGHSHGGHGHSHGGHGHSHNSKKVAKKHSHEHNLLENEEDCDDQNESNSHGHSHNNKKEKKHGHSHDQNEKHGHDKHEKHGHGKHKKDEHGHSHDKHEKKKDKNHGHGHSHNDKNDHSHNNEEKENLLDIEHGVQEQNHHSHTQQQIQEKNKDCHSDDHNHQNDIENNHNHSHGNDTNHSHSHGNDNNHSHSHGNDNNHSHSHGNDNKNGHGDGHGHGHNKSNKDHNVINDKPEGNQGHESFQDNAQTKKKTKRKINSSANLSIISEKDNYNMRAAMIHVIGDIVQSVGVVVAAVLIRVNKDFKIADPICTFIFSILVIFTTIPILKDCILVIMEASPNDFDQDEFENQLYEIEDLREIHDIHVWQLSVGKPAISIHIIANQNTTQKVLSQATILCRQKGIYHSTIQIEDMVSIQVKDSIIRCQQNIHK